jgi:hypothetical protein
MRDERIAERDGGEARVVCRARGKIYAVFAAGPARTSRRRAPQRVSACKVDTLTKTGGGGSRNTGARGACGPCQVRRATGRGWL